MGATTLAALCIISSAAGAQVHTSEAAQAEESEALFEVVVTAQRKSETLRETPLAVTALTSEALAASASRGFTDFAKYVPGVSFDSSGAGLTQINLRGVTTGPATASTVGIYIDEVPYGGTASFSRSAGLALDVGLFDLDRVEVLRGPQGTLYGASSMGGLIKYVSREPDSTEFGANLGVELSSTHNGGLNHMARASLNVPMSDAVAVRVGGYYEHDAGYIDNVAAGNDVDRSNKRGGRIDMLIEPSEALSIRLLAFAQEIDRDGRPDVDKGLRSHEPLYGPLAQRRVTEEPFEQQYRLAASTVTYNFARAQLTSVTSYQVVDTDVTQDVTALYAPLLSLFFGVDLPRYAFTVDTKTEKFTQELRLATPLTDNLDLLIGGFYTDEQNENEQFISARTADGSPAGVDVLTVALPTSYRELAGFADLTYAFTPRFDVAVGARLARNEQIFEQVGSGLLLGGPPVRNRSEETVITYLLNPRYKLSDQTMLYLRAASGYRPGGPNAVGNDPVTGQPLGEQTYDSDKLRSYEGGIKAITLDRRLSIDASAYHIDWSDLQIFAVRNSIGTLANAGRARINGVEIAIGAQPIAALELNATFAYTDAKLAQDSPDLGGSDGERLPGVPEISASLSGDYSFPLASSITGSLGGSVAYLGERASSFGRSGIPSYPLDNSVAVDLRGTLDFGILSTQLYVRNAFDRRAEQTAFTGYASFGGPAQITVLQPRTIGLKVETRF